MKKKEEKLSFKGICLACSETIIEEELTIEEAREKAFSGAVSSDEKDGGNKMYISNDICMVCKEKVKEKEGKILIPIENGKRTKSYSVISKELVEELGIEEEKDFLVISKDNFDEIQIYATNMAFRNSLEKAEEERIEKEIAKKEKSKKE